MKTLIHHLLLPVLLIAGIGALHGQTSKVPSAINYQGVLTASDGTVVAPTTPLNKNIEFRIYDAANGGNLKWAEIQTVTVYKGNFSVILGNGAAVSGLSVVSGPGELAALLASPPGPDLFFGIKPENESEFTPRQKLLSSAFALRAKTAESVDASSLSPTSHFNWLDAKNVTMDGHSKVTGSNVMEFGYGTPGKDGSAGFVGYKILGSDAMSIVGAGETNTTRKLKLWAEGGTEFTGPINFGARTGQHINLYNNVHGIGVQYYTLYSRVPADGNFAWFLGGSHVDGPPARSPGAIGGVSGKVAMHLDDNGLTLDNGAYFGNGYGLTNLNPSSLPSAYTKLGMTGTSFFEFGVDVTKGPYNGRIGYNMFNNTNALNIVGAGVAGDGSDRKITLHSEGGLTVHGNLNMNGQITEANHGVWIGASNNQHAMGSQSWTTYFRTAVNTGNPTNGSFAWYRGGSHHPDERNAGGGTALAFLDGNGLSLPNGSLTLGLTNGSFSSQVSTLNFMASSWAIQTSTNGNSAMNFNRNGSTIGYIDYIGNYRQNSDRKLKTDIKEVTGALENLMKLRPTSYRFKTEAEDAPKSFGFIAQEVQEVFPNIVGHSDKDTLALSYDSFIPVTVAAVQEQQKQIETLNTENGDLKKRLTDLEAKLEKLAGQLPAAPASADTVGGK